MSAFPLGVVVVGGGTSSRFGADKLAVRIGDRTVLEAAVAAVAAFRPEAPVVLALLPERVAEAREAWQRRGVQVVAGGARRQDSVRNAVEALAPSDETVVLVHDGARPFVPEADVRRVAAAAAQVGAALLVTPVAETVKQIGPDGLVAGTVPRDGLARALTPQAFRAGVLRAAWRQAGETTVWTDESALVEAAGMPVRAVPGDPRNIKITRREDLAMVSGWISGGVRTGLGVDVHPYDPARPLWLCGVELVGEVGLAGHSDADVALHAVTDGILGGCGAGDIGEHFPPSDPRWQGASSDQFLLFALELAGNAGWRVVHCDVTLLAEQPRIGPHRDRLRGRLAELLGLRTSAVSLKATTTEGLGFVGRQEGMVAMAVVTLERA